MTKLVLFGVIGGILLLPVCLFSLNANKEALRSSLFRLDPHTNILIIGDSHTETSVNPDIITDSANVSKSGENYFYSYYKLSHILRLNPQIKTIVLGFSPHNIMKTYDSYTYNDRANQWQKYFPLFDADAREKIACFKMHYIVPFLQYRYGIPFRIYEDDFSFYGGYQERRGSFLTQKHLRSKIASHFRDAGGSYAGVSRDMVEYLERIIALCEVNRIHLVLFSAPLDPQYRALIPNEALIDFKKVLLDKTAYRGDVSYLDLSTLDLPGSSFYDCDHVNLDGAKIVSGILADKSL